MTCPFCGASDHKDTPGEFACGSGVQMFVPLRVDQSDICRELCQLREKKAEGLEWRVYERRCKRQLMEADWCEGWFRIYFAGDKSSLAIKRIGEKVAACGPFSIDAAKAHAEELHQQAWRELRNKWDAK